ncbi:hypothetical protein HHL11_05565 [Ramlibacter sp. G-1-2-2]|uniref:Uncharacterized protein n=1 Tax=Ramlibacter agri TaxID=2728837 RepID=A0A848H100_9BURK|nr:hypothetical protein [Ramlibacter agri]NML43209.1 hypothetical protein [Ramlibacter agri]
MACTVSPAQAAGARWASGFGLGGDRNVAMRLSATGTVLAVDSAARLMTLKSSRGDITFRLDPKVANAGDIHVGDRVKVDYVAALVLTLRRGGDEQRDEVERNAAQRSGPDVSLAAAYSRPITFLTEVVSVDTDNLMVRLKGPAGEIGEYVVHDRTDLVNVRPGDQVMVALNQAVAVGVTPAK